MKPIRVLTLLEANTITGPAKNVLEFIRGLRDHREPPLIDVHVATFRRNGETTPFLQWAGRESIPLFPIAERGRFDRAVLTQLATLVEDLKPDVIESHSVKSHFLVRWAGLQRVAPWIAFHHGYTWPDFKMHFYNQLDRWSLRAADRVLTVSQAFQRDLVRSGVAAGRIEVLHNAIDPEWGAVHPSSESTGALRARFDLKADNKLILIVGRLSKEKDHDTVLRAFGHLRKIADGGAQTYLLIVGEGPRRRHLEEIVRSTGLAQAVTFTGQVATAAPYYALADVCVLSSLTEGSPNALLEAMATRVPVVATRVGGIPEIVTDGESALLVNAGDWKGMAEAIRTVLGNKELAQRLAERAHARIQSRHSPAVHRRRLQALYAAAAPQRSESSYCP